MTIDIRGRTAVITGASRGIGKQVAIELGRRGADIVVAARTVEKRRRLPGTIGETVDDIEAAGGRALAVAADMADPGDLDRLITATLERFGRIDILVNNAAATGGRSWGASLAELSREEWMAQFDVNLHAPYTLTRAVVPIMQEHGGGRIVNLTTGRHDGEAAGAPGLSTPLAYPATKAALDQFCISVAPQLRALGVAIVNLNPGFVRTEMVDLLEQNGVDASEAIAIDIPTAALTYLVTCDDAMAYTGQILTAQTLVQQLGLLTG